jgi:hypothetical protein
MNKILQLSQILSVVLLLACTHSTVFGQEKSVQSNATSHSAAPQMPATFPVMQNTGNPDSDAKTYAEAKKAWIETHKEEYIQMLPGLSEEGKRLLATRAANKTVKEETPNLKGQPRPKMADFANEMDFHAANKVWIAANGEQNIIESQEKKDLDLIDKSQIDTPPLDSKKVTESRENNKEETQISSFPIQRETGDAEKDANEYDIAKRKWIEKHPDEYLRMTNFNEN